MATARKMPSGNYRIRIYDKRLKEYKSFTAPTKRQAEKMAQDYLCGLKIKVSNVTIKDKIKEYIALRSNKLAPTTIETYEKVYQRMSEDFLLSKIDTITDNDIIKEINRLSALYAPKTIKKDMTFVLPIIRQERPDLAKNIELPKLQKRMVEYPRAQVIMELFKGDIYELEVLLALCCSLRKEEIRGLKPSDLKNEILTINRVKIDTKQGTIIKNEAKTVESRRRIALPPFILKLYRQRNGEWIMETSGNSLYRHYKRIVTKAGFGYLCFHDLRHINASEMKLLNVPDKYAMERGGWSTDNILKTVYQSTFSDERKRYDEIIDNHFEKIYATKHDAHSKERAQIRYFKRLK